MELYKKTENGWEPEEVPDDKAAEAYLSGKYGVLSGKPVPAKDDHGNIGQVDPKDLHKFLATGGSFATQKEYDEQAQKNATEGLGSAYTAGMVGGLRGVAGPLAEDLLLNASLLGPKGFAYAVREKLNRDVKAHPWLEAGGEATTMAASALASGGESTAAREAELAEKAPSFAEKVAALLGPKAPEAEGPIAAKASTLREPLRLPEAGPTRPIPEPIITPETTPPAGPWESINRGNQLPPGLPPPLSPSTELARVPVSTPGIPEGGVPLPPVEITPGQPIITPPSGGFPLARAPLEPPPGGWSQRVNLEPGDVPPELQGVPGIEPPPPQAPYPPEGVAPPQGTQVPPATTPLEAAERTASRIADPQQDRLRQALGYNYPNLIGKAGKAAGEVAEDLARSAIGEIFGKEVLDTTTGKILTGAIKHSATGAVEFGLYQMGNELSEDALGDVDTNSEKMLSSFGHGSAVGFLFGPAAAAAGKLGGVVGDTSLAALRKIAPSIDKLANEQAIRSLSAGGGRSSLAKKIIDEHGEAGLNDMGELLRKYNVYKGPNGLPASPMQAFENVRATRVNIGEALDAIRGNIDELAKPEQLPTKLEVARAILSSIADDPGKYRGAIEKTIGVSMKDLDRLEAISKEMRGHYAAGLAGKAKILIPERDAILAQLHNSEIGGRLNDFADKQGHIKFQDLAELRKEIDGKVSGWNKMKYAQPSSEQQQLYEKARWALEDTLINKSEPLIGKSGISQYKSLKKEYNLISLADKQALSSAAGSLNNQRHSLKGTIGGWALAQMGLHAAGPVGGLAGMVGAEAYRHVRNRGPAAAASILDKLSKLAFIRKTVANADKARDGAVRSLRDRLMGGKVKFTESPSKIKIPGIKPIAGPEDKSVVAARDHKLATLTRVASLASMPAINQTHIANLLGGSDSDAPKTTAATAQVANRVTQYLLGQMPKDNMDFQNIVGPTSGHASDQELDEFMRKYEGTDVLTLYQKLANGQLTKEHMDSALATNAASVAELRGKVAEMLSSLSADERERIPPNAQMELMTLFNAPVSWQYQPTNIRTFQSNDVQITQSDGRPTGKQAPGRPAKFRDSVANQSLTPGQAAQERSVGEIHS